MSDVTITSKRAYDDADSDDGYRVLVDRLWPRGISKSEAELDDWKKGVAPSDDLRKRFHEGKLTWNEFRKQYLSELKQHREDLRPLAKRAEKGKITLIYGGKDREHNNAVVLRQYLKMLKTNN